MLSITLPFPIGCSGNHRLGHGRGRQWASKAYKAYGAAVASICMVESLRALTGPIALEIVACQPDKRRRDLDNIAKVVCDQLAGKLYQDDSQIMDMRIKWGENVKGGEVRVRAWEVK